MHRPDDRPLRRLPQLEPRKETFERCVFCPKLCRSACPVSNAEPRETITPWGKMSMSYFVANESVPLEAAYASPAWACTGCYGCREYCDHKNDVTGTLFAARSAMKSEAPEGARRVLERFGSEDLARHARTESGQGRPVLVGCEHARSSGPAAKDALAVVRKLEGGASPIGECCGAPLLYAGDAERFAEQGRRLRETVRGRVVAIDAGCASALRTHGIEVEHVSELLARNAAALGRVHVEGPVRWHDPCQLGRGLGVYEAPRHALTRMLGRPPEEFERNRADARCSGAGGLLPVTMPSTARAIARQRIDDHERSGGGLVVTGCASSARSFAKAGAKVVDLVTLARQALVP
jgi:dimethylglycine catabolism B